MIRIFASVDKCVLSHYAEQIEEQVVSVILELASADSLDEYRTEAVAVSIQKLKSLVIQNSLVWYSYSEIFSSMGIREIFVFHKL